MKNISSKKKDKLLRVTKRKKKKKILRIQKKEKMFY